MIKCSNCGESSENNLEISYDHSLNGMAYCTCRCCNSRFVVQVGEGDILGKYIADRSKFFTVLETAKLRGDYSGSPTYEWGKLIGSYPAVAEIDPIYHWYKIEIITNGFTDHGKIKEAEKEFLKIPESNIYFVSKEDATRHGLYARQYEAYKQEIQSDEIKRKKKKSTIIKLVVSLLLTIAAIGAALGIYSCYRKSIKYVFALNYGELNGEIASVEAKLDDEIEGLPVVEVPDEKYYLEFTGWYTEKDGGGIRVANADGKSNLKLGKKLTALSKNQTIQLYAGYKYKKYSVTFYTADGNSVIETFKADYGTQISDIGEGLNYGDAVVLSWSKQVGGTAFSGTVENDTVLYASSLGITFAFETDGGSAVSAETYKVGETVTLPSPEKQYYSFEGWIVNGQNVGTSFTVPDKKVTLTAQWTRTHYSVNYDSNGGAAVESEITRVGTNVSLPVLTRQYYRFAGWKYGDTVIEESLPMPDRNITLVAQWEKTHYKVTFHNSYGASTTEEYVLIGESCAVPQVSRTGYDFVCWVASGGVEYAVSITPDDDVTLNPKWSAKSYNVTYNANGGTLQDTNRTVTYGSGYTMPVPVRDAATETYSYTYGKSGKNSGSVNFTIQYIFDGWYTSSSGGTRLTDKSGKSVSNWSIASNATAYAHWKPLTVRQHKDVNMKVYDEENHYDLAVTTNIKSLFGYSVAELRAMGYTKLNLGMFLNLREIDDGYQELYILNSYTSSNKPSSSTVLWSKTNIEHTSGDVDKTNWTHYHTAPLDLTKVSEDLYFVVNANGKGDDYWYLNYVDLYFTVA